MHSWLRQYVRLGGIDSLLRLLLTVQQCRLTEVVCMSVEPTVYIHRRCSDCFDAGETVQAGQIILRNFYGSL